MGQMACETFESVEAMDAELSGWVRAAGAQKYGLGLGLLALARVGGHHELGFSSVEAYALERCGRSSRWVQEARAMARRLEELPAIRSAVLSGRITFSMAGILTKVATAENEAAWLVEAEHRTVRQMRRLVQEHLELATDIVATAEEARATLTVTVRREDAWVFECARMIVRRQGGVTREAVLEAVLGEGATALLPAMRRESIVDFDDAPGNLAQRKWEAQLAAWREEAEARCEAALDVGTHRETAPVSEIGCETELAPEAPPGALALGTSAATRADTASREDAPTFAFDGDADAIDAKLRSLAEDLARRDLAIGVLAERFSKADGWRRLGYATDAHYCRERLGCCLSSIKAKRALARRVTSLRQVAEAIERRELGFEAARLVAAVATNDTVGAWVARARARTVKCLRDEVEAARMLQRLHGTTRLEPPSDATMRRVASCEARVVSGEAFRDGPGQLSALLEELAGVSGAEPPSERESSERGKEPCREPGSTERTQARSCERGGKVTLRFRVGAGLARYFRWLEHLFRRHPHAPVGFLRFCSLALIDSWKHALATETAYGRIYARDGFRCVSPVCLRGDVTPHHLRFRSHGGDDSDENVASLCVWCHLEGIHGGRLRATPPASNAVWTIGANAHTVVRGRERVNH